MKRLLARWWKAISFLWRPRTVISGAAPLHISGCPAHGRRARRYSSAYTGVEYVEIPKSASNSIRSAILRSRKPQVTPPSNFVFTFVRHPLSRLVSGYVEKIQTGAVSRLLEPEFAQQLPKETTIEEFVDFLLAQDPKLVNNHFCPQSWIVHGAQDIQFVGRLENITKDWQVLMDRGAPQLRHVHKTQGIKPWQDMLDAKTEEKARHFYRDDFQTWPDWWD